MAWSCDGRRLASGSFDRSVSIYTLDKYGLVREAVVYFCCVFSISSIGRPTPPPSPPRGRPDERIHRAAEQVLADLHLP